MLHNSQRGKELKTLDASITPRRVLLFLFDQKSNTKYNSAAENRQCILLPDSMRKKLIKTMVFKERIQ